MEEKNVILSMKNVTKIYPGVKALEDVSVDFYEGEVHAIVGENGAGKSTFIKCLTGANETDGGSITVFGQTFSTMEPKIARGLGIEAIYQEYNLVNPLTAAENICLGKKYGKLVNRKQMNAEAQKIFDMFKININPNTLVRNLTSAQMQIVEIAKSVSKGAKILIMDEPTAPLTVNEVNILFDIVKTLKENGVTIIYISHRLEEIFQLCDRVSVFRDGKHIITKPVTETNRPELIKYMVGREMSETYPARKTQPGEVAFEIKNLTGNGVKNISLSVRKGEVLGLGGLVGAGRSEIMKVAYGAEHAQWGQIFVHGKEVTIKKPKDAMALGIGLVPEDRKREGCFLNKSVKWNTVIASLKKISKGLIVSSKKELEVANNYKDRLRTKATNLDVKVLNLSGGNQQKVVLSKTLAAGTDILILDEPTRGIDVGAKHEIYELMNELCEAGVAIIMISSDMEELIGMSDRLVILHEREYSGSLEKADFDQERILDIASGGTGELA